MRLRRRRRRQIHRPRFRFRSIDATRRRNATVRRIYAEGGENRVDREVDAAAAGCSGSRAASIRAEGTLGPEVVEM